jgi:HEAT repeat protein
MLGFFKPNVEKMRKNRDVEGLIKALRHRDNLVREEAAAALCGIRDARAVKPFITALKDESSKNQFVRRDAVKALGRIGDARAVEPLSEALWNDYSVREAAAEALEKIEAKKKQE